MTRENTLLGDAKVTLFWDGVYLGHRVISIHDLKKQTLIKVYRGHIST